MSEYIPSVRSGQPVFFLSVQIRHRVCRIKKRAVRRPDSEIRAVGNVMVATTPYPVIYSENKPPFLVNLLKAARIRREPSHQQNSCFLMDTGFFRITKKSRSPVGVPLASSYGRRGTVSRLSGEYRENNTTQRRSIS